MMDQTLVNWLPGGFVALVTTSATSRWKLADNRANGFIGWVVFAAVAGNTYLAVDGIEWDAA